MDGFGPHMGNMGVMPGMFPGMFPPGGMPGMMGMGPGMMDADFGPMPQVLTGDNPALQQFPVQSTAQVHKTAQLSCKVLPCSLA